jgi:hypothetical protein
VVSTILQVAGVGAIVAGISLIWLPAGIIAAGLGLVLIGLAVAK